MASGRVSPLSTRSEFAGAGEVIKGEPLALATPSALGAGRGLPLGAILSRAEEGYAVDNSADEIDLQRCVMDHLRRRDASRNRHNGAVICTV